MWSGDGKNSIRWNGKIIPEELETPIVTMTGIPSGNYKFISDGLHLGLINTASGQQTQFSLYTQDGDGTDGNFINIFGVGTISEHTTNYEKMVIQYGATAQIYVIKTLAAGTGTVRPIYIYTGANTDQLYLAVDGTTTIAKGIYKSSDGTAGTTGTKQFYDASGALQSITFKNGLITSWYAC